MSSFEIYFSFVQKNRISQHLIDNRNNNTISFVEDNNIRSIKHIKNKINMYKCYSTSKNLIAKDRQSLVTIIITISLKIYFKHRF